jgi:hypothetical protein
MQQPPHSRSNFIVENNTILIGARPEPFTLQSIIDCGVQFIVNLADNDDSLWYKELLPENIKVVHIPTKNGSPPTFQLASTTICEIQEFLYENTNSKVYIHCNGGHGRAGTFGALLLGKIYNFDAMEAIYEIEKWRLTRPDQSRCFIPTPETQKQVDYIVKHLGLKHGNIVPDRRDRSWLKIVKRERKLTQNK